MKPFISPQGVQVETFQEIFNRLADGYRQIYGQNIDLSQNTPDGQRIGIEARAILESQEFGAALANSFDPDFAQGLALQKIAKLSATFPRPATKSTWNIKVITNRSLTLPAGYKVEDDIGQEWVINSPVPLPVGETVVTFTADEFGAVEGFAGAGFTQISVVLGVVGFIADVDSTVGINEETDVEFRARRNQSLELPALSTVGALLSRVVNLSGVTDAVIYENDTPNYDSGRDIEAHTIWLIVEGGNALEIASAIVKQKTAGTGLKGEIEQQVIETITRPDASIFQIPYLARFDTPEYVDLHIRMDATRLTPTGVIDLEAIKLQLSEYRIRIGQSIQSAELYEVALLDTKNYILTDLEISDDGVNFTDGKLIPNLDQKYQIKIENIDINEIIP